ncbi:homeobox-domain-containing protein [Guyanagaster necrorhizus]|uniref:Homeobox-domain-containing protein n=1 Tax=Guyanagaster necrorhizus TaxID=856835 RepID=A0A9P7W1G8_9AGAR|nr:homeobox-domain-containing protein [Guyanagaster necrorhizus MCA 3950]KAG7450988.1 homeobox-domain-containing protein [Guyanagaster necrorhizus MCA 3950]
MASRRTPLTRSTRSSLRIDPSFHESDASGSPSPGVAAASHSPYTPINSNRPSPSGSDSIDDEKDKEPASGPKRSNSSTSTSSKGEKERRKRSRVTAEQLVHLEQFFAVERSPTAARRREISELLGMEERQTQVWFQNRRAKAKMLQAKNKDTVQTGSHPVPQRQADIIVPESPPKLLTGFQADLQQLIHESEPITIIPCTNLSIGTWRRIASSVSKYDLVAYVCESKQTLAWFISSNGCGFKMEMPFDNIVESRFINAGPGLGLASFTLSRPPTFFLERIESAFNEEPRHRRAWSQSADWTEAYQATNVLRHELIGSALQLSHLVRALQNRTQTSVIYLHTPAYSGASPVEIPRPPMGSLTDSQTEYSYAASGRQGADYQAPTFTGASGIPPTSIGYAPKSVNTVVPAMAFTPSSFSTLSTACAIPDPSSFGSSYNEYQYTGGHQMVTDSAGDYGQNMSSGAPPTHGGPYLAQPVPRALYRERTQFEPNYQADGILSEYQMNAPVDQYDPASPPLLTTPFYPPTNMTETYSDGQGTITPGVPAIKYEVDDGSVLN